MKQPEYTYSELPAIQLFQQMGYQYYNGSQKDEREKISEVLLKDRLLAAIRQLNPWINDSNLHKAYMRLTNVNGAFLMEINQVIWGLLRNGHNVKQIIKGKEEFRVVQYIDYQEADNNDFLVVNQMRYHGRLQTSIPDVVVYINGIPIAVLECKSPIAKNAWGDAYSDLNYYQENSEKLFHYNQLCVGIWGDNGKYGAINAPQQFYSYYKTHKDDDLRALGEHPKKQAILLYFLFRKDRLLDLIRHFVLFEREDNRIIKKLPRYQQWRATNKTIKRLQAGQGGVVWHTQGSGKSLTMAYVTRKLQAPEYGFENPTVMIMTDRKDLDRQITTTFRNVGFKNVNQAISVVHLDKLLRNTYGGIITTTLQKFQETDSNSTDEADQTEEEERGDWRIKRIIKGNILTKITKVKDKGKWVEVKREDIELEELSQKKNLYILVDEAHRSHYGFLAALMRTVLPHAKFVAFTGTPISNDDKSTLGEFYGGEYIDVYTIMESVADGATVKLLYDKGIAMLSVKKEALDAQFEKEFGHFPEEKKDKLKRKALKDYQLSTARIEDISKHIIDNYREKIRPNGHKAMIVCSGRLAALKYQQTLHRLKEEGYHNFESKVVVSLGGVKSDAIAKDYYETKKWNEDNPNDKKPIWVVAPEDIKAITDNFKLPFEEESDTEKSDKKKYDNTAFIIVSDMLLTGWDAPIASCLYLDKPLKEHNLLQAIARVNRSKKGKGEGYIMDYNGITNDLLHALKIFSGDIRPDDIMKDINEELPVLAMNHSKLVTFFKPMKIDRRYERAKYVDTALRYIQPIDKRDEFKAFLKDFNKLLNIVLPNVKALKYQYDFKLFNEIKLRARSTYLDDEELKITKDESRRLQAMIDEHLESEGIENLLEEPVSIIDRQKFKEAMMDASPATKELKMRNNLKHSIRVGLDKNPDFYKALAQRLEELLQQRAAKQIDEAQLLLEYTKMQTDIINGEKDGEEEGFTTEQQKVVYVSMKLIFEENAVDATKTLFDLIDGQLGLVGWQEKAQVKKIIENKIKRFLKTKLEQSPAKAKAKELLNVLIKNS